MLERYVASILASYIGKYVKNLNKDTLKVSIWHGDGAVADSGRRWGWVAVALSWQWVWNRGVAGCLAGLGG